MTHLPFTRLAASLPSTVPFVGPESQERAQAAPFLARLGANENVFGPSPKAIEAMARAASDVWKYGDPENHDLRHALAAHHGVGPENIVVGEGIDALLGILVRLLVEEGGPVVTSNGAYPTFNFHVAAVGGVLHKVPYRDDHEDIAALLAKASETGANLIYLANPDNPMGSWHPAERVVSMMDAVSATTVLCLDEAYGEFAPDGDLPDMEVSKRNVIRMRTFSKAYGMAGARVGYAIGHPDLIVAFDKLRNHFAVNRIAQAGALAALADQDWLAHVKTAVSDARDRIGNIATQNGLTPLPSATNFVTIDCGRDGDYARAILAGLVAERIFVRMPFVAPGDRCIRISVGTKDDLDLLSQTLPGVLSGLS